jgi:hypothetical protein
MAESFSFLELAHHLYDLGCLDSSLRPDEQAIMDTLVNYASENTK